MPEIKSTLLLTVAETAEELRVARSTVYKFISSGELKSIHIGSRRLIRRSDLESFIANCEESTEVAE